MSILFIPVYTTEMNLFTQLDLTLIPAGEPTSGPHCFRAKYLGIFFYVKNLKKIAKGQEFCSL
jgi:hypothetical protein